MNAQRNKLAKVFRALTPGASQVAPPNPMPFVPPEKDEPEDIEEGDSWEPPEYDYAHFIRWAQDGPLHNVMSVDVELDYLYRFRGDLTLFQLIEVLSTLAENTEFLLLALEEPLLWESVYGLWESVEKRCERAAPPHMKGLLEFNKGERYSSEQGQDFDEVESVGALWEGMTLC